METTTVRGTPIGSFDAITGNELLENKHTIDALNARIAELEAQLEREKWHKYPDVKPQLPTDNPTDVANIPLIIQTASGLVWFADYNTDSGNFWRYGGRVCDVISWRYLPNPPEEEK